jgi:hypothetical protein
LFSEFYSELAAAHSLVAHFFHSSLRRNLQVFDAVKSRGVLEPDYARMTNLVVRDTAESASYAARALFAASIFYLDQFFGQLRGKETEATRNSPILMTQFVSLFSLIGFNKNAMLAFSSPRASLSEKELSLSAKTSALIFARSLVYLALDFIDQSSLVILKKQGCEIIFKESENDHSRDAEFLNRATASFCSHLIHHSCLSNVACLEFFATYSFRNEVVSNEIDFSTALAVNNRKAFLFFETLLVTHTNPNSFVLLLSHLENGWKYLETILHFYLLVNSHSYQPVYLSYSKTENRSQTQNSTQSPSKKLFQTTDNIIVLENHKQLVVQWVYSVFNAISSSIVKCMKSKVVVGQEYNNNSNKTDEMALEEETQTNKKGSTRGKFIYSVRNAAANLSSPPSSLAVPFSSSVLASLQERDESLYRLVRSTFRRENV